MDILVLLSPNMFYHTRFFYFLFEYGFFLFFEFDFNVTADF